MDNIDNFKSFVRQNPNLVSYVRNGSKSWQEFYELYDLYGDDKNIWDQYLAKKEEKTTTNSNSKISNIMEMAKNIDTNKLQDSISSVQKAIDLFGSMIVKDKSDNTSSYSPRPIYKKFDD